VQGLRQLVSLRRREVALMLQEVPSDVWRRTLSVEWATAFVEILNCLTDVGQQSELLCWLCCYDVHCAGCVVISYSVQ
jgi:hypothetical protein